jgi:hypothetical protein
MRSLAAAIVVLAGCLLWGAGAYSVAWVYQAPHGGNINIPTTATYGGMGVVAVGFFFLWLSSKGEK